MTMDFEERFNKAASEGVRVPIDGTEPLYVVRAPGNGIGMTIHEEQMVIAAFREKSLACRFRDFVACNGSVVPMDEIDLAMLAHRRGFAGYIILSLTGYKMVTT